MVGRMMTTLRKRLFRRGQTGQSLVILAIGFIALCAFVGIVTDVSLLFVRYSTLRRAVDAAAVAAAGQMRRDPNYTNPGDEQAASIAHLNLAARQFIEVYGLNPDQVIVETCQTQQIAYNSFTAGVYTQMRPLDGNGVELYTYNNSPPYAKFDDNAGADVEDRRRYEQLCKDNELKLVRVTAQIVAPTVFLRLLGFQNITLTESSISQTAVLDVVMILDVSESMAYDTTYEDWDAADYSYRYVPPYMNRDDTLAWTYVIDHPMDDGVVELPEDDTLTVEHPLLPGNPWFGLDTTAPVSAVIDPLTGARYTGPMARFVPGGGSSLNEATPMCQVRPAPYATAFFGTGVKAIPQTLYQEYVTAFGAQWVTERFNNGTTFEGFFPQYDSYACCNDPNGNFDFDDLICQPFQQVRDATFDFLGRLDFIRGDRVAFVTFDHTAHIIDPDGTGGQRTMIETQINQDTDLNGTIDIALSERYGAEEVLRSVIGVRAEPTYYADDFLNDDPINGSTRTVPGSDGRWDGLVDWDPNSYPPDWNGNPYSYFQTTIFGNIFVQPIKSSCFLDRAVLEQPQVAGLYHNRPLSPPPVAWALLADATSAPPWFWNRTAANDPQYFTDPVYRGNIETEYFDDDPARRSAEYRGGCGGGNIGAALGQSQQALINDGRTEGAIWLMVLMSDGASGVSDPIARDIDYSTNPFTFNSTYPNVFNFDSGTGTYAPQTGDYGAFGVCPYGTDPATGGTPGELLGDNFFPFCSDKLPETRHFCSNLPMPPTLLELTVDCNRDFYDTDDYARDWADWVTLADLTADLRSPIQRETNEQLPTIFTIGIGLDFNPFDGAGTRVCNDNDWACRTTRQWTYEDYLGEQLLRYIGDVGDNFRLDDDYWQCYVQGRIPNPVDTNPSLTVTDCSDKTHENWGPRGPCELQDVAPSDRGNGNFTNWLQPQQSCGNYFAAGSAEDLENVFGVIASRMFTRLSQ